MQWFVQVWNQLEVLKEDAAVAVTYRYEVAVSMLLQEKISLEVAEICLKVLDWQD
jgi:hypothetical protein